MNANSPVLLVVKREKNSELLDELLQENGYSVQAAASFHEAETALSKTTEVSVVILDLDGFTTDILSQIRDFATNGIPLVLVSRSIDGPRNQLSQLRTVEFLEKPLKKQELLHTVRRTVELAPPANSREEVQNDDR